MQVSFNAQINGGYPPDMSGNQGLWQQAIGGQHHHHHHQCQGQDGSSNGQQGLSSQVQQLEQEVQQLENQISQLQGGQCNGASNGGQSSGSSNSGMWGNIAQDAITAIGMFL